MPNRHSYLRCRDYQIDLQPRAYTAGFAAYITLGISMGQKFSPPDLALYRAVDEVLHYIWDPIGVSGVPEARDEYQSYLPQVFKLVREKQNEEAIASYLNMIATERMGLSALKEHDLDVAQLLLNWQSVIYERNA